MTLNQLVAAANEWIDKGFGDVDSNAFFLGDSCITIEKPRHSMAIELDARLITYEELVNHNLTGILQTDEGVEIMVRSDQVIDSHCLVVTKEDGTKYLMSPTTTAF